MHMSLSSVTICSPIVRSPAGSTSRARCSASDVARSALAGVTARMMAFSPCTAMTASVNLSASATRIRGTSSRQKTSQMVSTYARSFHLLKACTLIYVRAMFSRSCTIDFGCPSIGTFVRPAAQTCDWLSCCACHCTTWLRRERFSCSSAAQGQHLRTWHVDHGQIGDLGRVDGQLDGVWRHRLPDFGKMPYCFLLNLPPNGLCKQTQHHRSDAGAP